MKLGCHFLIIQVSPASLTPVKDVYILLVLAKEERIFIVPLVLGIWILIIFPRKDEDRKLK